MELIIKEIHAAVMEGDSGTAQKKVQAGLPADLPAAEILNRMIAADASRTVAVAKSLISAGDIP
jgi:methanogenic corrinoid protein MtbC1